MFTACHWKTCSKGGFKTWLPRFYLDEYVFVVGLIVGCARTDFREHFIFPLIVLQRIHLDFDLLQQAPWPAAGRAFERRSVSDPDVQATETPSGSTDPSLNSPKDVKAALGSHTAVPNPTPNEVLVLPVQLAGDGTGPADSIDARAHFPDSPSRPVTVAFHDASSVVLSTGEYLSVRSFGGLWQSGGETTFALCFRVGKDFFFVFLIWHKVSTLALPFFVNW